MARKALALSAISTLIASAALSAAPAQAQYYDGYGGGYQQARHDRDGYRGDRGYQGDRGYRGYGGGRGYHDANYSEGGRGYYRGRGNRYRCDRGTGGTIIGAIAGGLLGNSVAGYGDRTAGALLGAGVGALAGRAIDRDC